jgi:hypothetical protein
VQGVRREGSPHAVGAYRGLQDDAARQIGAKPSRQRLERLERHIAAEPSRQRVATDRALVLRLGHAVEEPALPESHRHAPESADAAGRRAHQRAEPGLIAEPAGRQDEAAIAQGAMARAREGGERERVGGVDHHRQTIDIARRRRLVIDDVEFDCRIGAAKRVQVCLHLEGVATRVALAGQPEPSQSVPHERRGAGTERDPGPDQQQLRLTEPLEARFRRIAQMIQQRQLRREPRAQVRREAPLGGGGVAHEAVLEQPAHETPDGGAQIGAVHAADLVE